MNYKKDSKVKINGWVRNNRGSSKIGFISLYDGIDINPIQLVYKSDLKDFTLLKKLRSHSVISIEGIVNETKNREQNFEILVTNVLFSSNVSESFPIQNKEQTLEFLRENYHLRTYTTLFRSVFRVRSSLMFAIETYFNNKNFIKVNTPIITSNDSEGAGEVFTVTTRKDNNYKNDFFSKKAFLTVSGQLAAESMAQSMGKVYTFGPTFRAENSNTMRHISEFWMLEPEMPFSKMKEGIKDAEDLVKFTINWVLKNCIEEINFLDSFNKGIKETLVRYSKIKKFKQVKYSDAIVMLEKNNSNFENKVKYGVDLSTEHEKYLADKIFKEPIFVYDYPKDFKAFYMKKNDDGKTVAAFDLLVPNIGELVGGSERETRYDVLIESAKNSKVNIEEMQWYFDLRKQGMTTSVGYGLGFERLVMMMTGMKNIRDTIPFPRFPKSLNF